MVIALSVSEGGEKPILLGGNNISEIVFGLLAYEKGKNDVAKVGLADPRFANAVEGELSGMIEDLAGTTPEQAPSTLGVMQAALTVGAEQTSVGQKIGQVLQFGKEKAQKAIDKLPPEVKLKAKYMALILAARYVANHQKTPALGKVAAMEVEKWATAKLEELAKSQDAAASQAGVADGEIAEAA